MKCPLCNSETVELYGYSSTSTFWYCFNCLKGFEVNGKLFVEV